MKILIRRNAQDFGPYTPSAVQLYLEQGKIRPLDLARLETESDADWRSLAKLMRQHGIASPVLSDAYRPAKILADLRGLDLRLLWPWHDIRSGRWLRDRRVLTFVGIGMLPILMVCLAPGVTVVYWGIAFYFAALWALFLFQLFRTQETQPRVAVACFLATSLVAIPVLLFIQRIPPLSLLHAMAGSPRLLTRFAGMFLGVGISEEICKAAVVYFVATRPGRVLLPQTVVLYGMISGLGFGCFEGVGYQIAVNRNAPADLNYFLNVLRLTSLPFLHAVWTGISAYFISFSTIVPSKQAGLLIVAVLMPALFHGLYNTLGPNLLGLGMAVVSVFFLMSYLAGSRELKAHLTGGKPTP
jgi:RsiW-degrading membrane proteinase PrsW (M82 family)